MVVAANRDVGLDIIDRTFDLQCTDTSFSILHYDQEELGSSSTYCRFNHLSIKLQDTQVKSLPDSHRMQAKDPIGVSRWEEEAQQRSLKQIERLKRNWALRWKLTKRAPFEIYRCKEQHCTKEVFGSPFELQIHTESFMDCTARLMIMSQIGQTSLAIGDDSETVKSLQENDSPTIPSFQCSPFCGHHLGFDPGVIPRPRNPRRCHQIRKPKRGWDSLTMDVWDPKTCLNCGKDFWFKGHFEYHLIKKKSKPSLCFNTAYLGWDSRRFSEREVAIKAFYKKMYQSRSRVTPIIQISGNQTEWIDSRPSYRKRRVMPLQIGNRIFDTCADTGSAFNIMSLETAKRLQLPVRKRSKDMRFFSLADGRFVQALGRSTQYCSFPGEPNIKRNCVFYIWGKCTTSVIMGRKFLEETEAMATPTRFTETSDLSDSEGDLPSVRYIGSSQRRIPCYIDGVSVSTNPDSGSDLDLMSAQYAKTAHFDITRKRAGRSRIKLADGTIVESIGVVEKDVTIGEYGKVHRISFQVLPGLQSDLLLGDTTLLEAEVFTEHRDMITEVENHEALEPDCAPIIHLSTAEKMIFDSKRRIKRLFHKPKGGHGLPHSMADDQRAQDARENHRRCLEEERIAQLPESDKYSANEVERIRRENYMRGRKRQS